MFENADEAILANVIAVDDFDARDDIDLMFLMMVWT